MAMLEVKAPVRSYTTSTTYNGEAFTYKAPLGLKVVNGSQELSLCNVGTDDVEGKDIFRCILVPSETEMTIEGQFQDGNVEVYFPAVNQEVKYTPAAGTYQGINIAYTYDYGTAKRQPELKVTLNLTVEEKGLAINETNFPDATFREYVSDNFDKNDDQVLSKEEVDAVTSVKIIGKSELTSLKGIDLSNSNIEGIVISLDDIKGAIINELQAVDLISLIGVKIKLTNF